MNWPKAALFAVLIVIAFVAAHQWRKLSGAVILPLTLVALYAVWRWGRDWGMARLLLPEKDRTRLARYATDEQLSLAR
jgi:hypothetical protein